MYMHFTNWEANSVLGEILNAVLPVLGATTVQTFPLLLNLKTIRWSEGSLLFWALTFWIMVCRLVECSVDERVVSSHYRGTSPWITSNYFLTRHWNNPNTEQFPRYYIKWRYRHVYFKSMNSVVCYIPASFCIIYMIRMMDFFYSDKCYEYTTGW